jgi:hypothetical protein
MLLAKLLAPLALFAGSVALAQDEAAQHVDSVLDRLEKRLLDQESDGLTFGEKTSPKAMEGEAATKYDFTKRQKVVGSTKSQESLKSIGSAVAELETQVDQFSANVQKTKQSILDEAHIDNFITFEATLADTDAAAITAIAVKLDGFGVYELKEAAGIWMPSVLVPLYAGPLKPGNHRVDVEARIVVKPKKALPMNGDVYRFVNKTFDVAIPGGAKTSRYILSITPPEGADGKPDATLKEAT